MSEFDVVGKNAYVSTSTFAPSFFTRPLNLHQTPGKANSDRGSGKVCHPEALPLRQSAGD